jgi:hypothetical protein
VLWVQLSTTEEEKENFFKQTAQLNPTVLGVVIICVGVTHSQVSSRAWEIAVFEKGTQ